MAITLNTITSDRIWNVSPTKSNMIKSYSPEKELIMQDIPNPNKKFIKGPENIPAIAVEA